MYIYIYYQKSYIISGPLNLHSYPIKSPLLTTPRRIRNHLRSPGIQHVWAEKRGHLQEKKEHTPKIRRFTGVYSWFMIANLTYNLVHFGWMFFRDATILNGVYKSRWCVKLISRTNDQTCAVWKGLPACDQLWLIVFSTKLPHFNHLYHFEAVAIQRWIQPINDWAHRPAIARVKLKVIQQSWKILLHSFLYYASSIAPLKHQQ